ncbi:DoxX family protein [Mesorhizobium sp. CAU 1732]|uniref:DoxX family protein n=1 Tax=Mesorhizobium sp. CAU 1732 TaxID=3140358 RepID=UPI00326122D0
MIFGLAAHDLLAWALAIFFFVGAIGNWIAPANVRAEYARWGYPDWFHYVTAVLELVVAVLLIFASTRVWGVGLGIAVMLAAIATLLIHKEYRHALLPTSALLFLALQGYLSF